MAPADPAPARAIIVEAMRRASRAGESHEMAARWAMEDLRKAGFVVVHRDRAVRDIREAIAGVHHDPR